MLLISGIDRKYKVVIPELMYLTLAAYRKVPPQSAKWIREREWIAGYRARETSFPLSFFIFSFFFLSFFSRSFCELAETEAGWRRPADYRPAGEVA